MSASTSSVHVVFISSSLQRRLTLIALHVSFTSHLSTSLLGFLGIHCELSSLLPSYIFPFMSIISRASSFRASPPLVTSSGPASIFASSFLIVVFARYPLFCLLSLDLWAFVIWPSLMTTTSNFLHLSHRKFYFFFLLRLLYIQSDTLLVVSSSPVVAQYII